MWVPAAGWTRLPSQPPPPASQPQAAVPPPAAAASPGNILPAISVRFSSRAFGPRPGPPALPLLPSPLPAANSAVRSGRGCNVPSPSGPGCTIAAAAPVLAAVVSAAPAVAVVLPVVLAGLGCTVPSPTRPSTVPTSCTTTAVAASFSAVGRQPNTTIRHGRLGRRRQNLPPTSLILQPHAPNAASTALLALCLPQAPKPREDVPAGQVQLPPCPAIHLARRRRQPSSNRSDQVARRKASCLRLIVPVPPKTPNSRHRVRALEPEILDENGAVPQLSRRLRQHLQRCPGLLYQQLRPQPTLAGRPARQPPHQLVLEQARCRAGQLLHRCTHHCSARADHLEVSLRLLRCLGGEGKSDEEPIRKGPRRQPLDGRMRLPAAWVAGQRSRPVALVVTAPPCHPPNAGFCCPRPPSTCARLPPSLATQVALLLSQQLPSPGRPADCTASAPQCRDPPPPRARRPPTAGPTPVAGLIRPHLLVLPGLLPTLVRMVSWTTRAGNSDTQGSPEPLRCRHRQASLMRPAPLDHLLTRCQLLLLTIE